MKKSIFLVFILLFLFLIPFISAINFDMKESFDQGETLIGKITGYFLEPIIKENVLFYREHVRISLEYEIAKMNDDYYIYADLANKNFGNYSILIKDTRHMSFTEETEEDIVQNFTITKEKADFSINPGFISASGNFFIEAKSLQDEDITIQVEIDSGEEKKEEGFFASLFGGGEDEEENVTLITIKPGQTKDVPFYLSSFVEGMNTIKIISGNLTYEIPAFITFPTEQEEINRDFKFEPPELNISLSTNSTTSRILYLMNIGEQTLENISISASNSLKPYLKFSVINISNLENGSSFSIEITVNKNLEEKNIDGHVKAKIDSGIPLITYSQISLSYLRGYVPTNDTENESVIPTPGLKPCSELRGMICQANLECSGERVESTDGICCLATCQEEQKSPAGRIIGISIFVLIVVFLIWFYKKKYKKKEKKEIDLLKIGEGKK